MLLHACGGFAGSRASRGPDLKRKMRPPRTAKASNPGRGRNFTRDGQAGLGHPTWGGRGAEVRAVFKGISTP